MKYPPQVCEVSIGTAKHVFIRFFKDRTCFPLVRGAIHLRYVKFFDVFNDFSIRLQEHGKPKNPLRVSIGTAIFRFCDSAVL